MDVHPGVASRQDTVVGLAVLELDHLGFFFWGGMGCFIVSERVREKERRKGVRLREGEEEEDEVEVFFDRDGGGRLGFVLSLSSTTLLPCAPFPISLALLTHHGVRLRHLEQEEREHGCLSFRNTEERKREEKGRFDDDDALCNDKTLSSDSLAELRSLVLPRTEEGLTECLLPPSKREIREQKTPWRKARGLTEGRERENESERFL